MTISLSPALRAAPADPAAAVEFFAARLAFQADVADVHTSLESGSPGFTLVDSRGEAGCRQGRIPGAVHLATADIASRARDLIDTGSPVITYCWGPGCDGATRAALEFARLGYRVKEMIGGIEYWIREGLPIESAGGRRSGAPDPLTGPAGAVTCDC